MNNTIESTLVPWSEKRDYWCVQLISKMKELRSSLGRDKQMIWFCLPNLKLTFKKLLICLNKIFNALVLRAIFWEKQAKLGMVRRKWCLQIFFIFGYFAQNNEKSVQLKFFWKIPSRSWDMARWKLPRFDQIWSHQMEEQLQMHILSI